MTLPAIPIAPGTRTTIALTRPLYFNRFVGHASARQDVHQALGADVAVRLTRPGRRPSRTTGTLAADGHVGVVPGIEVELLGVRWVIEESSPVASSTTDEGIAGRLMMLGYLPQAYNPADGTTLVETRIFMHMIYDFQGDHGIVATGRLDATTRDRVVEVFGA
jgi:hypothetical protein